MRCSFGPSEIKCAHLRDGQGGYFLVLLRGGFAATPLHSIGWKILKKTLKTTIQPQGSSMGRFGGSLGLMHVFSGALSLVWGCIRGVYSVATALVLQRDETVCSSDWWKVVDLVVKFDLWS